MRQEEPKVEHAVIAVIGLGNIGLAIGRRLVERGQDVCGVDLAEERRAAWRDTSGRAAASSLAEVPWAETGHVFVIVRLTDQAASVLDELERLPLPQDLTVFLITTLELPFARQLAGFTHRGFQLIELPVSGGERGALAGELAVMAAGPLREHDEALLLETIAAHVVRFDEYGEPTLAKLLNNVTAAYNARTLAEMLLLGRQLGIDPTKLYGVLRVSSGGSWMADAFLALVDDLLDKDVHLLRRHLGELPSISLDADADLPGRLSEARALLTRDDSGG